MDSSQALSGTGKGWRSLPPSAKEKRAAAADVDAEFVGAGVEAALEGVEGGHAFGEPGGRSAWPERCMDMVIFPTEGGETERRTL